ncbi:L-seryl-tRNA selenium transferase [Desulfofarcimen acetoxidans DSM 771]|uniref:L-seryl-tRNA(Sec) selenium transferase n=1 Tax=Desulfofarcimen acetoxidans (strain ATCC 49208 / DSM 771 / KCTC 5769 / VKM B-1644 / 5575) TaxID=485916 RepID=C8VWF1_DESAS|nr:L-seryl-tRNA(Sec) selenium transferase [Desulfofarcimen acetoxidans]ACV62503.1 L-seryl-tRNA selenium transferase [Desulfofarcimen acetoxidans DSM 771]
MNNQALIEKFRLLPSVDEVLKVLDDRQVKIPHNLIVEVVRRTVESYRERIIKGLPCEDSKETVLREIVEMSEVNLEVACRYNLRPVINATGVVLHTNLGRAILSENARRAVQTIANGYANLELDLTTGKRGSRYSAVEGILTGLTGAEAALVVNNNASAVLLALGTLARNKEVIVSRGQLVEIGGSFRIPDVMAQSGAILVEVGTTNKTYPEDYRRAVSENTGLLLQVHTSNYRILGFTRETTIEEMVEVGRDYDLPVMSDLGSGFLVDLSRFGLPPEPTVQEVVRGGADVVTFSGDKLLGGPQAGIIVGKKKYIDLMKKNPLTRAVRIDKFTVASLEATLRDYLDPKAALQKIPTLRMLTALPGELEYKADVLVEKITPLVGELARVTVEKDFSRVGGGAMPITELPTTIVSISPRHISLDEFTSRLRRYTPAVIGRVQDNRLLLDPRTVLDGEEELLVEAVVKCLQASS